MGPYNRLGDSSDEVSCRSLRGMNKVVRLFPEALDVLRCVKQQVGDIMTRSMNILTP